MSGLYFDEDMTPEQWRQQEDRDAAEQEARDEAEHRFREDAREFLENAAAADDHSSDADPGAVDPWEER